MIGFAQPWGRCRCSPGVATRLTTRRRRLDELERAHPVAQPIPLGGSKRNAVGCLRHAVFAVEDQSVEGDRTVLGNAVAAVERGEPGAAAVAEGGAERGDSVIADVAASSFQVGLFSPPRRTAAASAAAPSSPSGLPEMGAQAGALPFVSAAEGAAPATRSSCDEGPALQRAALPAWLSAPGRCAARRCSALWSARGRAAASRRRRLAQHGACATRSPGFVGGSTARVARGRRRRRRQERLPPVRPVRKPRGDSLAPSSPRLAWGRTNGWLAGGWVCDRPLSTS